MSPTDDDFEQYAAEKVAIEQLLEAFTRQRRIESLGVAALVAEHRACYLWDRQLRTYSYHSHALVYPFEGAREFRKRLRYHLDQNTRHLNKIEALLLARGEEGLAGIKAIFRTDDIRYRLRVMDEAIRLFPYEAEQAFEAILIAIRDAEWYGYYPGYVEAAIEQLRTNRLAPTLRNDDAHSLSPTLGRPSEPSRRTSSP